MEKGDALWGAASLFLYAVSGIFIASETALDLLIQAVVAIVVPTIGWLLNYYIKRLVIGNGSRKTRLESKETFDD